MRFHLLKITYKNHNETKIQEDIKTLDITDFWHGIIRGGYKCCHCQNLGFNGLQMVSIQMPYSRDSETDTCRGRLTAKPKRNP